MFLKLKDRLPGWLIPAVILLLVSAAAAWDLVPWFTLHHRQSWMLHTTAVGQSWMDVKPRLLAAGYRVEERGADSPSNHRAISAAVRGRFSRLVIFARRLWGRLGLKSRPVDVDIVIWTQLPHANLDISSSGTISTQQIDGWLTWSW
ncbi:MAG: hypothetical protein ACR2IE_09075 [Candidatus Sumerlaeaceae bacterium]